MIANRMGTIYHNEDNPFVTNQINELQELVKNAFTYRTDLVRRMLDPRRDYNKECGYLEPEELQIQQYKLMYDRNPIAARVVQVLPEESWQSPPEVYESEDETEETEFEAAWKRLGDFIQGEESFFAPENETHPIWEYLKRADVLSGIGHFGIMLLGIDDGKPLWEPIDGFEDPQGDMGPERTQVFLLNQAEKRKQPQRRRLMYLSVFDESMIDAIDFETNRYSPRFNRPKYYTVRISSGQSHFTSRAYTASTDSKIHWSRVLHFADNVESSEVIAVPRQQQVFDRLIDLVKLYGGAGEGYWRGAFPGISFETHPQLGGDVVVDSESLKGQIWDYMNGLQRALLLMGMSAKSLAPQVSDPTPQINANIEAICIRLAIPKRIFMGSERGELASSQDDSMWNDRLRDRKHKYITPRMIVPFINRLIQIGVLPRPKDRYRIYWPDPEALKPQEKAEIAAKRVEAMSKYIGGQVDTLMDPHDFLTREMDLTADEAEEVLANAEEYVAQREEKQAVKQEEQMELQQKMDDATPPRLPGSPPEDPPVPANPVTDKPSNNQRTDNANCGTGAGGFKPGNSCAKGSKGMSLSVDDDDPEYAFNPLPKVSAGVKRAVNKFIADKRDRGEDPYENSTLTEVDIADLRTGQSRVKLATLDYFTGGGRPGELEKDVVVFRVGQEMYLKNGNHRVVSAMLNGHSRIKVRMVNVPGAVLGNANCGTGAGGFKPGNTCAAGGKTPKGAPVTDLPDTDTSAIPKVKKMDRKSREVLDRFEGGGYADVNDAFRKGFGSVSSAQQREAIALRKVFNTYAVETTKDMVVYRGIDKDGADLSLGSPFEEKAFVSVSTKPRLAAGFSTEGQMMAIRVPKGTRVLPLPDSPEGELLLDQSYFFKPGKVIGKVTRGDEVIDVYETRMANVPIFNRRVNNDSNCGTGAGGFKPGNKCAKGRSGGKPKKGYELPSGDYVNVHGEVLRPATRGPNGELLVDGKPVPEHVRKAAVPPAWTNVKVNLDPNGTEIARGKDAKGRTQTRYSANHDAQQSYIKFKRCAELRKKREGIFKELDKDAKNPELRENADCLRLVMQTGMRPGGSDTDADYESYGATTLLGKHIVVEKNKVVARFVPGKSKGQEKTFPIHDPKTAAMLVRRKKAAGDNGRIFNTNASSLREYSKTKDGGGFKTKDHRTAVATETAIAVIKQMPVPTTMKQYKAQVKAVGDAVAGTINNTRAVSLKRYIDPIVFNHWRQSAEGE